MDIQQKNIDKLNAKLKIKIKPEDYEKQYSDALKTYRKQVSLPGFRPGNVPMSVVKKRFGKSILVEELNKVLNDSIYKHISENKLNILGNPLPSEGDEPKGDFDNPGEFEFEYELGLAPEIDTKKVKKQKVDFYTIKVDDKLIDQQVEDFQRRYGQLSEPESSQDKDLIMGTLVELDENDEVKEGGLMNDTTLSIEFVEDKKTKEAVIGLKPGDSVVVDPHKISKGHDDLGRMLDISHEEVHHLKGNFRMNVKEIKRLQPAVLNQELFDKVYGKDTVKNEEEFRSKVSEDLGKMFLNDSGRMFKRDMAKVLVEKVNPELPDGFLKKWISAANENPLSEEQIESDYPGYAKGLQWQLIENAIAKEMDIKVEHEEILNHTKGMIASQYAQYGIPMDEEQLGNLASNSLSNREEYTRIHEYLMEDKVVTALKSEAKVNEKEVSYDDFLKLANEH